VGKKDKNKYGNFKRRKSKHHIKRKYIFDLIFAVLTPLSAISWRPVLVVEEAGENHRPWASN